MARDCTEPRKVICRNCDEEGHMSAECSKPRRMQCRNCDEYGHTSRECPQPEDRKSESSHKHQVKLTNSISLQVQVQQLRRNGPQEDSVPQSDPD